MSKTFKAYRIHEIDKKIVGRFEQLTLDDLAPGNVVVRVLYSDINYKDALAATGAGRILRKYPLVGGIDLAGVVESSTDSRCKRGDHVLVTGCGLSETHDGGYAEYARLNGEWVIPMPPGFGAFKAMSLGTAGFTAALAIHRMEHNGQTPAKGPIVVTGATGGVGSIAIDMLAGRGYEVIAVSGKAESVDYLKSLGAAQVLLRQEIDYGKRPLEAARFGGAIDNVGGEMLTWLTRTVDNWGNIASIGLAGGADLHTTVMPFILRGVNLLGINSSATLRDMRLVVWNRIATDLKPRHLERIATRTIAFDDLPGSFDAYLQGTVTGRAVIKIGS
ncbi:MAG: acryloyl-CoA reductase [Gammaproteobacteria bacterium]|jgi:acrylyl-CoA reductase (NADPH)|nr:acryloyl-CoA reductase [Gammaproteobacteria bacterium]NBR17067.1 acryloyl-CoA reductase [Gammaproteobacteria bacterium]NCW21114.1 acryloyl-CoA reductase [Gammaproteobacteria bacterium]NCW56740.1 acryloyl-CoA reductase [Gammaproteobacteria bacterium]NDB16281.1 acryloyl-CoA reductase [Gammaproteobacteria bacterium]